MIQCPARTHETQCAWWGNAAHWNSRQLYLRPLTTLAMLILRRLNTGSKELVNAMTAHKTASHAP
jgi:hypothetical protein